MGKTYIGIKPFMIKWRAFNEAFKDLKSLWPYVTPYLQSSINYRFSAAGPGWAKLSRSTIMRRVYRGTWPAKLGTTVSAKNSVTHGHRIQYGFTGAGARQPILQEYGTLRKSLMPRGKGAGIGHIEFHRKHSLTYGTGLTKAAELQGDLDRWIPGAQRTGKGQIPRPFLYFDNSDVVTLTNVTQWWVDKHIQEFF